MWRKKLARLCQIFGENVKACLAILFSSFVNYTLWRIDRRILNKWAVVAVGYGGFGGPLIRRWSMYSWPFREAIAKKKSRCYGHFPLRGEGGLQKVSNDLFYDGFPIKWFEFFVISWMDSEKVYFERWRCVSFLASDSLPVNLSLCFVQKGNKIIKEPFTFAFTAEQSFDILRGDWKVQPFKILRCTRTKLCPFSS